MFKRSTRHEKEFYGDILKTVLKCSTVLAVAEAVALTAKYVAVAVACATSDEDVNSDDE